MSREKGRKRHVKRVAYAFLAVMYSTSLVILKRLYKLKLRGKFTCVAALIIVLFTNYKVVILSVSVWDIFL